MKSWRQVKAQAQERARKLRSCIHAGAGRWNGEPCEARKVTVEVGKAAKDTYWDAGLEGTLRKAVKVTYNGDTFYLDDEDGSGWRKVTEGQGSWRWPHKTLTVAREVDSVEFGGR